MTIPNVAKEEAQAGIAELLAHFILLRLVREKMWMRATPSVSKCLAIVRPNDRSHRDDDGGAR